MDLVRIRKKAQREKAKKDKAGQRTIVDHVERASPPVSDGAHHIPVPVPESDASTVAHPEQTDPGPSDGIPASPGGTSGESVKDNHVRHTEQVSETLAPAPPIPEGPRVSGGPEPKGESRGEGTDSQSLIPSDAESSKEFLELATEELYKQSYVGEEEGEKLKILCFRLSSEEYAIPVAGVREIIRPRNITEVPRVPDYILGIISLRGIVVPVFDLRKRLGLHVKEITRSTRIIIASDDVKTLGMVVDEVTQVVKIPSESVEPPPLVVGGIEGEFIQGVGRDNHKMVILLNLKKILDMDISLDMRV